MAEAIACGTPVAAFPVPGPRDVLTPTTGAMADDLAVATAAALRLDRAVVGAGALAFSWRASAEQFVAALAPTPARKAA